MEWPVSVETVLKCAEIMYGLTRFIDQSLKK